MKKSFQIIVGLLATLVGLYPITFFLTTEKFGLLSLKSPELLRNHFWNLAFYGHIVPGGIALLIGWLQFNRKWRTKNIDLHRRLGKLYVFSVIISATCSLFLAVHATGGFISVTGFFTMGIIWLSTTIRGWKTIKNGKVHLHEKYMTYSYAACFSGVTLRIWLPLLVMLIGSFNPAYQIAAWLCWVPNMLIAYTIIKKKNTTRVSLN